ncbi:DHA2 family efflux MFS transporter permease subunit [Tabrizicola sp. J26]|uniref:DHA2 family efflux MFS transporter permease subunit n=1 Tax=Alitabrizicola rongguiensis TaxID=2909234 RepID=UPI001F3C247F|nr:DHA2 family efflux MFS transporter permease subunit [Tabrizicola rongguiensis]MCF1710555.1 DHA2 family efflux MFS transporter permease subunit [Tabrizicola rongguiensis]
MTTAQIDSVQTSVWRNRITPLIVATALLMENIDSTVISTSLPQIARDLNADPIHLKLALTSYLLALAIFIPASGWAADRFGARKVFRLAILVFTLGSIACAQSDTLPELIAARVLQGIGGSMMTPVGRLIVLRSTPKSQLVNALAWLTVPALIGPVIGPPLGGFITTYFDWRWIFWINVPVAVLGLILVTLHIRDIRMEDVAEFDFRGFFLVGPGIAAFLTGITLSGLTLAPPIAVWSLTLSGIALLIAYVWHALRVPDPIMDLRLLKLSTFRISVTGGTLFRIATGALPFLLPLMLQFGFGLSAFHSGLLTFATGVGALTMKFLAQPILQRFGFRRVMVANTVIAALFLMAPGAFQPGMSWLLMITVLFVGGISRSLQFTSINAVAYADVPPERLSSATSFNSVLQQLSGSVGITVAAFGIEVARGWNGSAELTAAIFPPVFVMIGCLSLLAIVPFARLSQRAGSGLLGEAEMPRRDRD